MPRSLDRNFGSHQSGLISPATGAAAIIPSDTTDLPGHQVPRALYAVGAGLVRVTPLDGGTPVTLPILSGVPLPMRVSRVWYTGTTADGLVGVW